MTAQIRVLVVDDSALVRRSVKRLLEEEGDIEVVGTARNGLDGIEQASRLRPDVVTLDISMPVMDGLDCLCELVRRSRQRVVMLSTLARENSFTTFRALALGAVDFVTKPGEDSYLETLGDMGRELRKKVRIAAAVRPEKIGRGQGCALQTDGNACVRRTQDASEEVRENPRTTMSAIPSGLPVRIAGFGGSTGGATALEMILKTLPEGLPLAILAVQHLPSGFSRSFATYLDTVGPYRVKEAVEGEELRAGYTYLAPHGFHMRVQATGNGAPVLRLDATSPPQGGYRPSISLMLYSLAAAEKHRACGVLLSGMGDDGVGGLIAIHRLGGRTYVQDEKTSVVFGMGERAIEAGAVDEVLPADRIGTSLSRSMGSLCTAIPAERRLR